MCLRTFDVSVDLLLRVQVVEALQDLLQHGGNLSFIKRTRPELHTHPTSDDTDIKALADMPEALLRNSNTPCSVSFKTRLNTKYLNEDVLPTFEYISD